ncbi:MAG: cation transporter [Bacteroidales bacterium]|nr:cation transporter [Bacteroidales bacterium]
MSNNPFPGLEDKSRNRVIIRTSIISIVTNVLLAAFKAVIGIVSNSIAVTLDAVNNLSDALSSIITIVGTKLAGKTPTKKHPLGYGRIEYLSAMIVAGIVLYAGITSAVESVKKIIWPEEADYSTVSLIIIAVAVLVKVLLGTYVRRQGRLSNSGSLVASGSDALFDAVLSASVLASALIFLYTGLSLEAWVGALISVFIIKSGIEMMRETLDELLGQRADSELTKQVKKILCEEPAVSGAYDLVIHNYGPSLNLASVHLELPDTMTVQEVDDITRRLTAKVYKETGILLAGVGVYSCITCNEVAAQVQHEVRRLVLAHDWVLQMHGFYLNAETRQMHFDAVLDFGIEPAEAQRILHDELHAAFPEYDIYGAIDINVSD